MVCPTRDRPRTAFHLTARIMLGMGIIGVLWLILDYFLLRPLEEATIARWGLVQR